MSEQDQVLAKISASAGRRWLGILSVAGLGIMLLLIAFARPPELSWQIFLFLLGFGFLWIADRMRRATELVIEVTREGVRDTNGVWLARLDEIDAVERGMLAFKPSNGFLIRTHQPAGPRAWNPGLWWRFGKNIGIGGVTPGPQTKFAAEMLTMMIAERDGLLPPRL